MPVLQTALMKKALIALGILLVVVVGGLYFFGGLVLGKVAKAGVETFVPQMTRTSVAVDRISISPVSGSGTVAGFVLGNPEGYSGDYSIAFDEAYMRVAPLSILGDRILIEKVHVRAPRFHYERKLLTSNINEILKNVQAAAGRAEGAPAPEPSKVRIEIRELIIEEGQVSLGGAGLAVPLPIPRIVLRDLGTAKGGITPDEMAFEVMSVVLRQVLEAVAKAPGSAVDSIRGLFRPKD